MQDSCLCVDTSTGNYMLYVHDVPGSVLIGLPQWSSWSASRCSDVLAEGTYIYIMLETSLLDSRLQGSFR